MADRKPEDEKARALRDLAVLAVMRHGALEPSGAANLAVARDSGLMIGYHTPFNPLPRLCDSAKYEAIAGGKDIRRGAYGIDIWLEDSGKVFSAGWDHGAEFHVRLCKPGIWQSTLEQLSTRERLPVQTEIVNRKNRKDSAMARKKAKNAVSAAVIAANAVTQPDATPEQRDEREKRLRSLEQENRHLRRAISGLMLDKLILAKAAAGNL